MSQGVERARFGAVQGVSGEAKTAPDQADADCVNLTAISPEFCVPVRPTTGRRSCWTGKARSADGELAFLGHALERFGRTLDPVLTVVAIGR